MLWADDCMVSRSFCVKGIPRVPVGKIYEDLAHLYLECTKLGPLWLDYCPGKIDIPVHKRLFQLHFIMHMVIQATCSRGSSYEFSESFLEVFYFCMTKHFCSFSGDTRLLVVAYFMCCIELVHIFLINLPRLHALQKLEHSSYSVLFARLPWLLHSDASSFYKQL